MTTPPPNRNRADHTLIHRLPVSILNHRWCPECMKWVLPGRPLLATPSKIFARCARHFWQEYKAIWP